MTPNRADLAAVAIAANDVSVTLDRVIRRAVAAGVTVDVEIFDAATMVTDWAAWLGRQAANADTD